MIMLHLQGIVDPVFYPKSLFCPLALRTMTVTAAIICDTLFPTTITTVFMSAKLCRPAFCEGIKYPYLETVG